MPSTRMVADCPGAAAAPAAAATTAATTAAADIQLIKLQPLPAMPPDGPALLAGRVDLIGDLRVRVRAVVGEGELSVTSLFALRDGSVLPLDCGTNPVVDVQLDHKTVARGELVVVDDVLGVRITEVCDDEG